MTAYHGMLPREASSAVVASRATSVAVSKPISKVQSQAPDVNISTIYRNLDELTRLGVVNRTHLGGGPAAYHLASAAHSYLVCEQCSSMTEIPSELFGDLAEAVAARYGFAIDPHRFAVTGRCAACRFAWHFLARALWVRPH